MGPGFHWPIFQAGVIRASIKAEEAQAQAAALSYGNAVLIAVNDVEKALVRYGEEFETQKRIRKALELHQQAETLALQSNDAGETDLLNLIDAQRERTQAEDRLAQSDNRTLLNLITLYKALSGDWEALN